MTKVTKHTQLNSVMGSFCALLLATTLSACGSDQSEDSSTDSSTPSASPVESQTPGSSSESGVTKTEAGKIVTDKYGGQVVSVESDIADGESTWEVEVRNSDKDRIEVNVNQKTGKIVGMEKD